jgi:RNA polymerase sigma factor (TIGR02999 family)
MSESADLTDLVRSWCRGDPSARPAIDAEVYAALKRMARGRLSGAGPTTLNPTALVHEAVARLLGTEVEPRTRAHFYALVALQMRSVLVDHLRRRSAAKRGGEALRVTLDERLADSEAVDVEAFLDLHDGLNALATEDARAARAVELTYFAGLAAGDLASVLGVSIATVERDLQFGRAWLRARLGP